VDAEEVDVEVARALWKAGDLIVDVRTAEEYAAGHIAGAVNVPLNRIGFAAAELPEGQVLTVCSMGNRSLRAAETLARIGRPALSLRGGTKAWAAAGLPIVTGAEPGSRERSSPLRRLLARLARVRR
jgi:rhodanese-related sulfurtransferase